jgi:CubicO group peptidase (beta-lactamase class C family)
MCNEVTKCKKSERCVQAVNKLASICFDSGVDAAIFWRDGELIWAGPKLDESFYAWSITKSFTSICCGLMVDVGRLDIDVPAMRWLPELEQDYPTVTLRHLLTFTSGLATATGDAFQIGAPNFAPGARLHYSMESEWLGLAVTRAAGESMEVLFQREVADRIEMEREQWSWGRHEALDNGLVVNGGSGSLNKGLTLTPRALLQLGKWLLARGEWDGQQLLSRAWLDQATVAQVLSAVPPWDVKNGWYRDCLPGTYGLHFWTNGVKFCSSQRMWPSVPASAFALQGNLNQICVVIPEWNSILIRMGSDGVIDTDLYDDVLRLFKASAC